MAWLGSWAKRVKISTDNTDVTAALTNFPVLIHLSSSCGRNNEDLTPVFDELGASHLKLAVTSDDGVTQLYVEVEEWDNGNEVAWLWTKVTSIASGSDTDLYLYYDVGQANNTTYVGVPNSAVAENVWDTNFVFVSHMLDDPDTSNIRDSTQYDNDGAKKGANEPLFNSNGPIDGCQHFDLFDDYITFGDVCDFGIGDFTIEAWVSCDALSSEAMLVRKGTTSAGYRLTILANGHLKGFIRDLGGWAFSTDDGTVLDDSVTRHVAGVYDRDGNLTRYVNGAVDGTADDISAVNGSVDNAIALDFGYHATSKYFGGDMDEVRLSKTIRSSAWVKASYETGRDHFLSYGVEELYPTVAEAVGVYPPVSRRRRISEEHLCHVQIRRPFHESVTCSIMLRRSISESLMIDAQIRRPIQESIQLIGQVYEKTFLQDAFHDLRDLLLLRQLDKLTE